MGKHGQFTRVTTPNVLLNDAQATAAAEAAAQSEQGRLAGPTLLPPASEPYVCLTDHCRVRAPRLSWCCSHISLRRQAWRPRPHRVLQRYECSRGIIMAPEGSYKGTCWLQVEVLSTLEQTFGQDRRELVALCVAETSQQTPAHCDVRAVPERIAFFYRGVMTHHRCAAGGGAASRRLGRLRGGGVRADHDHARRGLPPRVRAVEPAAPEPAAHERRAPE